MSRNTKAWLYTAGIVTAITAIVSIIVIFPTVVFWAFIVFGIIALLVALCMGIYVIKCEIYSNL
jgi:hypothetical protein